MASVKEVILRKIPIRYRKATDTESGKNKDYSTKRETKVAQSYMKNLRSAMNRAGEISESERSNSEAIFNCELSLLIEDALDEKEDQTPQDKAKIARSTCADVAFHMLEIINPQLPQEVSSTIILAVRKTIIYGAQKTRVYTNTEMDKEYIFDIYRKMIQGVRGDELRKLMDEYINNPQMVHPLGISR